MRIVVVIPAFHESARVGAVVAGARPRVERVYVVDDGSRDGTAEAARAARAEVLVHETNRGKGAALATGFAAALAAGFDAVVTLDADGQHDPNEIPKLAAAAETADVVVGCRMTDPSGMPLVRRWTNRFMSWVISKLAGRRIRDSQSGYRLFRRAVLERVTLDTAHFESESQILIRACRAGFRLAEVPVRVIYGAEKSKIRPARDTLRFFRFVIREIRWIRRNGKWGNGE
ncbi:MAG: glycosyltransferase family 2 protein [Planctomycetota bacterium]